MFDVTRLTWLLLRWIVAGMLNRLHGQPESYDKKYVHRNSLMQGREPE